MYSFRHYYATRDLKRGVSSHALSRQLGNSTAMVDKHYSKYSPLLNAELHSGRNMRTEKAQSAVVGAQSVVDTAFAMHSEGLLEDEALLAALGVGRDGYILTEEIAMNALEAKRAEKINASTLMLILNG